MNFCLTSALGSLIENDFRSEIKSSNNLVLVQKSTSSQALYNSYLFLTFSRAEFILSTILLRISQYCQGYHSIAYLPSFSTIFAHIHLSVSHLFIVLLKSATVKSDCQRDFLKAHKSSQALLSAVLTFSLASFTAISVVFCNADGKVQSLAEASAQSNI
jgi:hypothetical protein